MVKHLSDWEMSKKANNLGFKIYIKYFVGEKTTFIKDYMQPSLRNTPDHLILHVNTNELHSDETAEYYNRHCNVTEK